MNEDDVARWQQDAQAAFAWIAGMYEQAQTLWDDAWRYFSDAGWEPNCTGGLGGIAMSWSDLSQCVMSPQNQDTRELWIRVVRTREFS